MAPASTRANRGFEPTARNIGRIGARFASILMRQADLAKFSQHARLRELLLATEDAEIVEDTTMDAFWGFGPDGKGENWAGRILMEVRAHLVNHP